MTTVVLHIIFMVYILSIITYISYQKLLTYIIDVVYLPIHASHISIDIAHCFLIVRDVLPCSIHVRTCRLRCSVVLRQ